MVERPLILLSNDDGYRARGLAVLRQALLALGDVVVCAPEAEQSASSHGLTLHRPLRLHAHEPGVFSVDGTPADCVYLALFSEGRILSRRPSLVVSGLNHGLNLGDDVHYSGTVAAAREGALRGVAAMALSASPTTDLDAAARVAAALAHAVLDSEAPPRLINVNFPPGDAWPLRVTRPGRRIYADGVVVRKDPRGREYFWLGMPGITHEPLEGSDTEAFDAGIVGVTPLGMQQYAPAEQSQVAALLEQVARLV